VTANNKAFYAGPYTAQPYDFQAPTAVSQTSIYVPTDVPALISPANGSYHKLGNAVPISWNSVAGASTYILWLQHGNGGWTGYNVGNNVGVNLTGAGLGTYNWDVEVRNSASQVIAASVTRTFHVTATGAPFKAPMDPLLMDGFFDNGFFDDDSLIDDSLTEGESSSMLIIQDENENVLSPTQGLDREALENVRDGLESGIEMFEQDTQDDWFYQFMTPEEYLYFQFLFGL